MRLTPPALLLLLRPLLLVSLAASAASCVRLPRRDASSATPAAASSAGLAASEPATPRVNINRATREELGKLPGIGPGLAARIVEHRERHGPFRRAEHLLAVSGISERRFAELRGRVAVD
jgi:competence protein ComEA